MSDKPEYPINEAIFGRAFRDLPDGVDEMRAKYRARGMMSLPELLLAEGVEPGSTIDFNAGAILPPEKSDG